MSKAHGRYGGLTQGQIREIFRNKGRLTIRQMALKYGVPEKTINAVRLEQARRRHPSRRGRVALVNA